MPLVRRVTAAAALFAYLTAAVGVPLPAATPVKNGLPFPCQGHACGCRTADQCWKQCCCYTAAERLAWADDHGVTPPPDAERPAAHCANGCCTKSAAERKAPRPPRTPVLTVLQCRGLDLTATGGIVALPPPARAGAAAAMPPNGRVSLVTQTAVSDLPPPPAPPPRLPGA